ncbi:hypothetical protein [Litorihabitans aurantiacus]|uniref:Uncharacterized protein n=1 Tax=Litorihabitans aurantiacus TaxID=1930061 RepID=A0AA37XJQ3_9MICO|nr:hypothetical protein [Litorihabitans aurantiacus]GMA33657.1 hypothetical protein GCM10025875_36490 [Litorihabitans aurantiacus]GMA33725.1 hypothetical protein GCM10025875_37170 [Litorihabitans aurantiacus]GMA33789.1 hypothetical protein GCM10025875_37810 [Litorihabitans aurantiacus]
MTAFLALPDPTPQRPEGLSGIDTLLNVVMWGGFVVCILALIVGGVLVALAAMGRTTAADLLPKVAYPLVGAIIVGAAAGLIGMFAG